MSGELAPDDAAGWTVSTRAHATSHGLATGLSRGERRAYVHTRALPAEGGRAVSILFDDHGRLVGAFREQDAAAALTPEERLQRQHQEIVEAAITGRIPLP